MSNQYGVLLTMSRVDDPVKTQADLLTIAREWLEVSKLRPLGECTIIRHADVSEMDWQLMGMTPEHWAPGVEVWGWKVQAERLDGP